MTEAIITLEDALVAVNVIRRHLGPDTFISTSSFDIITVTPTVQDFTLTWTTDGIMGWDAFDNEQDSYALIRRHVFENDPAKEELVMTAGDAINDAMEKIAAYLELVAQIALSKLLDPFQGEDTPT